MTCNLCGSEDFENVLGVEGLVECKKCGLVFFFVLPEENEIKGLYNSEVFSPAEYYKKIDRASIKTFSKIFNEVSKIKQPGRMLDIGCSTGTMMGIARESGWEVQGIELNKLAAEESRKKGFEVKNIAFEEAGFNDSYFDWVHMGDVIEHVTDPFSVISLVNKKMKSEGILTVSTPDISKWLARRFQIKPKEHLFYFNKTTMKAVLEKAGFSVLSIKNYAPYRNLSALAKSSTFNRSAVRFFFTIIGMLGEIVIQLPQDEMIVVAVKN